MTAQQQQMTKVNYIAHDRCLKAYVKAARQYGIYINGSTIDIYNALFTRWNEKRFPEWLPIFRADVMEDANVGSFDTYASAMKQLDKLGLLEYQQNANKRLICQVKIKPLDGIYNEWHKETPFPISRVTDLSRYSLFLEEKNKKIAEKKERKKVEKPAKVGEHKTESVVDSDDAGSFLNFFDTQRNPQPEEKLEEKPVHKENPKRRYAEAICNEINEHREAMGLDKFPVTESHIEKAEKILDMLGEVSGVELIRAVERWANNAKLHKDLGERFVPGLIASDAFFLRFNRGIPEAKKDENGIPITTIEGIPFPPAYSKAYMKGLKEEDRKNYNRYLREKLGYTFIHGTGWVPPTD